MIFNLISYCFSRRGMVFLFYLRWRIRKQALKHPGSNVPVLKLPIFHCRFEDTAVPP